MRVVLRRKGAPRVRPEILIRGRFLFYYAGTVDHSASGGLGDGGGSTGFALIGTPPKLYLARGKSEGKGKAMIDLKSLLQQVVEKEASDLHLKAGRPPIVRLHTNLVDIGHGVLTPADVEDIAHSLLSEKQWSSFARDGEIDFAYPMEGVGRFRTNIFKQRGCMGIVMRHVKIKIPSFQELGLPVILEKISLAERGIIIVSGATGCGKSTTLASMIDFINSNVRRNVITVEDPIEYLHRDMKSIVSQREVGIDTESFPSALRFIMRQDPDVIMVGEVRDRESFMAVLSAAEVGHMVLTTLHSSDAARVVGRVMDFFPPHERDEARMQIAINLQAVICQRLLQRSDGNGVIPAVEVMLGSPTVRKLIRENKIEKLQDAIRDGRDEGMQSFNQHMVELVKSLAISEEEALSKAANPEALKMNLQGIFLDESRKIIGSD
jgi:twitching motility protein PilT